MKLLVEPKSDHSFTGGERIQKEALNLATKEGAQCVHISLYLAITTQHSKILLNAKCDKEFVTGERDSIKVWDIFSWSLF